MSRCSTNAIEVPPGFDCPGIDTMSGTRVANSKLVILHQMPCSPSWYLHGWIHPWVVCVCVVCVCGGGVSAMVGVCLGGVSHGRCVYVCVFGVFGEGGRPWSPEMEESGDMHG